MIEIAEVLENVMAATQPQTVTMRIAATPGICGGAARIAGTRIPVWSLEAARRAGVTPARLLDMYPSLSSEDLSAAFSYAEIHVAEIDALEPG